MVFGYLVLTLALALWLAGQPAAPRALAPAAARWLLGLLAVAVLLADLPTFAQVVNPHQAGYRPPPTMHATNQLPVFITDGLYQRYLTPGETVVVVTHRGNAGMLFQAEADFYFKIAGGFINTSLTRQDAMPLPVSLLTHPTKARERGFTAYLRRAHVGAVLVDRAWSEPWMKIFDRLGMPGTTAGGVTVYPVSAWLGSADQRKLAP
jgi:hypothetical protein